MDEPQGTTICELRQYVRSDGCGMTHFSPVDGARGFYRTEITLRDPQGNPIVQRQVSIEAPSVELAFAEFDRQRAAHVSDMKMKVHAEAMRAALRTPPTPLEERRLRLNGRR